VATFAKERPRYLQKIVDVTCQVGIGQLSMVRIHEMHEPLPGKIIGRAHALLSGISFVVTLNVCHRLAWS